MKLASAPVFALARLLALVVGLAAMLVAAARADDYGDVSRLLRAGRLPEAQAKADQYLATKPRDPQMRYLKGLIQQEAGQSAEALATFTQLTEDFPELPEPYNGLAVLYAAQGHYDQARAALETAIRNNGGYALAYENLGDVYTRLAAQAYCKARQLDAANAALKSKLEKISAQCP